MYDHIIGELIDDLYSKIELFYHHNLNEVYIHYIYNYNIGSI